VPLDLARSEQVGNAWAVRIDRIGGPFMSGRVWLAMASERLSLCPLRPAPRRRLKTRSPGAATVASGGSFGSISGAASAARIPLGRRHSEQRPA
jgi:hypothetical protein